MTWYPIAFFPPQFEDASGNPYSGAVLKAYAAGTTTPIPMATTYLGSTTSLSFALNASGYPSHGGAVVIPHVQEDYKLALYPNQAAADANSGAVWTPDNIKIAEQGNEPFVEYFDGDGAATTFTLSEDFGTDERGLMVFADRQLPDHVSNGGFASDTVWTKGVGWTIGGGVATATGAISTDLSQAPLYPIVTAQSYTVQFTVTRSAGGIIPKIGGVAGTERTSSGTYTETIVAASTQSIVFSGNGFTGTVDNVVVKPTYASKRQILRPLDDYVINGNQLTLSEVPPSGTKNIIVFAPSLLLGATNNAAAAAAVSEANALASAAAAAASAALASDLTARMKLIVTTYDLATASGNQVITGVGFTPTAVIAIGNVNASSATSIGMDNTTTQRAIQLSGGTSSVANSANLFDLHTVTNVDYQQGKFTSFNSDGGNIAWTKTGSPTGTARLILMFFR